MNARAHWEINDVKELYTDSMHVHINLFEHMHITWPNNCHQV